MGSVGNHHVKFNCVVCEYDDRVMVAERGKNLKGLSRIWAVACLPLILVGCGNENVQDLKTLIEWNPEYTKNWAPSIGATLPALSVKNTAGETLEFEDLTGEEGLLIFFVRSTNW